jgi:hypothetical protein
LEKRREGRGGDWEILKKGFKQSEIIINRHSPCHPVPLRFQLIRFNPIGRYFGDWERGRLGDFKKGF